MPKKQTSDVSKEHIVAFWKCMYVDRYKHVFPETCHDVVLSQSQLWLARSIQWTKTVYFTTMTGCFPRCNSTFSTHTIVLCQKSTCARAQACPSKTCRCCAFQKIKCVIIVQHQKQGAPFRNMPLNVQARTLPFYQKRTVYFQTCTRVPFQPMHKRVHSET